MRMFVVLKMKVWESLELEDGTSPPVKFASPYGCLGFLPVFTDKEKAVEFAGDESLVKEITER